MGEFRPDAFTFHEVDVSTPTIQSAFTRNRSEELELDVWKEFVLPIFMDKLDLNDSRKPKIIEGGRGCGKTMLLRYLSYHSKFSEQRVEVPDSDLECIGLYWRADTQFLKMMDGRKVEQDVWLNVFQHFMEIKVALEIVESVIKIAGSSAKRVTLPEVEALNFDGFSCYSDGLCGDIYSLRKSLILLRRVCEIAISNPASIPEIRYFPSTFCFELAGFIRDEVPGLSGSSFFVYIDEYENLLEYQQAIINTKIKHSQPPLIFNIAMKANGMRTARTIGEESIQKHHDFRTYRLDEYLLDGANFDLFASEIMLSRLMEAGVKDLPLDVSILKDYGRISERLSDGHRSSVIQVARSMLPGRTQAELASELLSDVKIRRKILEDIQLALRGSSLSANPEVYIDDSFPRESIVNVSLLNREKQSQTEVLDQFNKLRGGEPNKYSGATSWTQNFFIGTYLRIMKAYASRPVTYYSGFDVFIKLSRGNIRHFLEIVRASVKTIGGDDVKAVPVIPPESQAVAVRRASEDLYREINGISVYGSQLSAFVRDIGAIFQIAHSRKSQSEPEINHFSVVLDGHRTDDDLKIFFDEAEKWGVLFPEKSTKHKANQDATETEYVLNPIYSPYFMISYAKKRKIVLNYRDVGILLKGSPDERKALRDLYRKKWLSDGQMDLGLGG